MDHPGIFTMLPHDRVYVNVIMAYLDYYEAEDRITIPYDSKDQPRGVGKVESIRVRVIGGRDEIVETFLVKHAPKIGLVLERVVWRPDCLRDSRRKPSRPSGLSVA